MRAVNRVARIDLVIYPALDAVFSESVIRAVLADELEHGQPTADRVETCLRATFPRVVLRPRDPLATYDEGAALWYAYRDGRFSPFAGDDAWWERETAASFEVREDGRVVRPDRLARTLLGIRSGEKRTVQELVPPETLQQFGWLGDVMATTGFLHSSGTIIGPGGGRLEVEYRVESLASGGWRVRLRPIDSGD